MTTITATEAHQRISNMQAMPGNKGLDGGLVVFPIDVYYFSGTRQNSTLWIPVEGDPLLLVRKSLARAMKESVLADIRPFPSSKDFPALFDEHVQKTGFTFDVAPVQQLNYYSNPLTGREFVDISPLNRELRSVKTGFEREKLRQSGGMLCPVFAQAPQFTRAGMAEQAGLGQYFMGMPGEQARFVGHGVGLELDEFPVIAQGFKALLLAGQTIAIEPKFVIPGKGAIGIENTFAVTPTGGEKITGMPDDIVFL